MNTIRVIKIDINKHPIKINNKIKSKFIMEITKKSETFSLTDTTDIFETQGEITYCPSESIQIRLNVSTLEGDYVGDCIYSKFEESDEMNYTVNCVQKRREELIVYSDSLITNIVSYLKDL